MNLLEVRFVADGFEPRICRKLIVEKVNMLCWVRRTSVYSRQQIICLKVQFSSVRTFIVRRSNSLECHEFAVKSRP